METDRLPIICEGSKLELVSMESSASLQSSTSGIDILAQNNFRRFSTRKSIAPRSNAAETDSENKKPAAENGKQLYSTSRRNGCNGQNTTNSGIEENQDDSILAEECAIVLASLDHRACARAQIRDANTTLEQLLLPISFPWSQNKEILYKPLPRDIDEMSILMQDDEDCSVSELNDETFRLMNSADIPNEIPVATARTTDPGVVELRTYIKPTPVASKRLRCMYATKLRDDHEEDSRIQGELSLQMYKKVQLKKRYREEFQAECFNKKHVSFRVGGTSSRSSIFSASELLSKPLFLEAIFPRLIQDGVKRFGLEGYEEGINLGNYNCRALPPKDAVVTDPTSKNRFAVGRTRLVWTKKEQPESKSQRAAYCSILTGQRLESNMIKRPLRVKVGIRVNGKLLSSSQANEKDAFTEPSYTHSSKSVQNALDLVCDVVEPEVIAFANTSIDSPVDYSQCYLNTAKFIDSIRQTSSVRVQNQAQLQPNGKEQFCQEFAIRRHVSMYLSKFTETNMQNCIYCIHGKDDISSQTRTLARNGTSYSLAKTFMLRLNIVPPRLDSLPTEDGLMCVTCSIPGKIVVSKTDVIDDPQHMEDMEEPHPHALLLNILASELHRCAACWKFKDAGNIICGHCKYSHGIFESAAGRTWMHTAGKPWSDLDDLTSSCFYKSTFKTSDTTEGQGNKPVVPWHQNKSCCNLCTQCTVGRISVVSCAAEGCNVRFHPICAMIVSAANEMWFRENNSSNNKSNGHDYSCCFYDFTETYGYETDDTYLSTQYAHSNVQASFQREIPFTKESNLNGFMKGDTRAPSYQEHNGCRSSIENCTEPSAASTTSTMNSTLATSSNVNKKTMSSNENNQQVILPIMFCPYHNPKRHIELHGFYPNGCNFSHDTVRIPPRRQWC